MIVYSVNTLDFILGLGLFSFAAKEVDLQNFLHVAIDFVK